MMYQSPGVVFVTDERYHKAVSEILELMKEVNEKSVAAARSNDFNTVNLLSMKFLALQEVIERIGGL